jgi:hypothetical protein
LPRDCRQWITEFVKTEPNIRKLQEQSGEDNEQFATDQEKALSRACEGTVLLIRRSFQTSRVEIVGRHALHCVNRRENGTPNNDKPFYGKQGIKTTRKYANLFMQISRYIWRTADVPERPKYRLTKGQKQALARLQHAASGRVSSSDEREGIFRASSEFWIVMFDHDLRVIRVIKARILSHHTRSTEGPHCQKVYKYKRLRKSFDKILFRRN